MKKTLLMAAAVAALCLAASCSPKKVPAATSAAQPAAIDTQGAIAPVAPDRIAPAFLKPGDKVALLTPSYTTPYENVTAAAEVLRGWGLEPVVGPNVGKKFAGKYAGTLEERAADLTWALADPQIKAIICSRGGYGSIRLTERLKPELFAANPKWIVGYSDITTLLEMATCAGVMSLHATMGNSIAAGGEDVSSRLLRSTLFGTVPQYELQPHPMNKPGYAKGTLVGGNICTLVPNVDTWADAARYDGIILFLEEVEESFHNIDRLFNMLRFRGILSRCKGIIFGEFTDCGKDLDYVSVEHMIETYLEGLDIPVVCGFPAGHGQFNLPLLMGSEATLDVRPDGASISFDVPGAATEPVSLPQALQ